MSENSQRVFVTKQPIFMIHDQKANKYDQMFVARTKAEAMRSFETECRNPNSMFNKFPADFTLVCTGEVSDTAEFDIYSKPEILASAAQFQAN